MLIIHKDSRGITPPEKYVFNYNLSIQDNIAELFPKGLCVKTTTVILNGQRINPLEFDLSRKPSALDRVDIVFRQQGTEIIAGLVAFVVSLVASVIIMATAPKPTIPNDVGGGKDSPNNRLTGQTNLARAYQAIPDIIGKVRAFPDLVQPSVSEYRAHIKYVSELMCVGVGEYFVEKVKYAETLLNDITGSTYKIYSPGDIIPLVTEGFESPDVNGQNIVGPNEIDTVDMDINTRTINSVGWISGTRVRLIVPMETNPDFNGLINETPGERVTVTFNQYQQQAYHPNPSESSDVEYRYRWHSRSAMGTFVSCDVSGDNYVIIIGDVPMLYMEWGDGWQWQNGINFDYFRVQVHGGGWVGPFISPVSCDQIWFNIIFNSGLKSSVTFIVEWWAVNNSNVEIPGTKDRETFSYSANTYDGRYFTKKITPKHERSRYAYRVIRTTTSGADALGRSKLEEVYAIRIRENVNVKDTLIWVETEATEQATGAKEKKINLEATRKMITYNDETGEIDYELKPSRDFADGVLHSLIIGAKRDPAEIDIETLYKISKELRIIDEQLGYHDFSYDDKDISLGQRITAICNTARVTTFRDGVQRHFVRDEVQTRPSVQFDARNLANEKYTKQRKISLPGSYDGVELEYIDATDANDDGTDKKAFIRLRIDKVNKQIVEGECNRPLKIQLAGCRNYPQAMNRAQLEARKLVYQRNFVEATALSDANIVQIGEVVRWADPYSSIAASGEVVAVNDTVFTTDQALELDTNIAYKVSITDAAGYPSAWIDAYPVDGNAKAFRAEYHEAIVADNDTILVGSRFVITLAVGKEPSEYILTQKKFNDIDKIKITLAEYNDLIYEYDEISQQNAQKQRAALSGFSY